MSGTSISPQLQWSLATDCFVVPFVILHAVYEEVNVGCDAGGVITVTGLRAFASKGADATLWFPGGTESCPRAVSTEFICPRQFKR